jgi:PAS domain S-box-containing protein
MEIPEKELSSFIEKIATAVIVCRSDSSICACNAGASLLLGYSRDWLIGRKISELDRQYLREDRTQMPLSEFPVYMVLTAYQPVKDMTVGLQHDLSDHVVWTKMSAHPDFKDDGTLGRVVVSLTDISDSIDGKNIGRQIKQAKDEWENTFDAIQDIVVILDLDRRIIRANKAAHVISGFEYGELTGRKCFEVFLGNTEPCPGCPAWFPDATTDVYTGPVYSSRLARFFDVSSSPIYDDGGKVKYLVHMWRDVTQKLKDEAEKIRLSAAIEQTSEVVVITDKNGRIQYVNPAFSIKTGYSRAEAIGQNPRILKSGEHDREFYEKMWTTLLEGRAWNGQLINRKKDGTRFWEDATISPVCDGEGQITNFLAVKRDISKEKSLERQLQQAMKMEAIGTLSGGIAHDFNNILSVMIGYGQMAKGRLEIDDPARTDIDQVLQAGDRAVDLVKQILTFSRQDTQEQFKPLSVQYLIKEVLKLLRSSLPMTIELDHSIQHDCSPILADSSQIHQVLMNLCTNAKQAIGGKYGRITVNLSEIQISEENDKIACLLHGPGNYVDLEVSDTGSGMDRKLQERIFEPFFTTKAKDHGTGLGLAVVHGIVKKHGGEIVVDSAVGQGTTFHVYFPVQKVRTDVVQECVELEHGAGGNERIMVVDDESKIADVFQRMLGKLGYKVTIFTDSIEAASAFRKNPDGYDVVLTDMTMPKMTGAELAREVLALRPALPVIMTTGFSEIIDMEKAKRIGIKEFLLKPVKKEQLSEVVRKVLTNG